MYRSNKKGFTIVELVIVIAVVAILAAVLIPTFAGLVRKANISNDTVLAKNLNTAAVTAGADEFDEALAAVKEAGYLIANLNAKASDCYFAWDETNDRFVLVDAKEGYKVIYSDGDVDEANLYYTVSDPDRIAALEADGKNVKKTIANVEDLKDVIASGGEFYIDESVVLDKNNLLTFDTANQSATVNLGNAVLNTSGILQEDGTGIIPVEVKQGNVTFNGGVISTAGENLNYHGLKVSYALQTSTGTESKFDGTTFDLTNYGSQIRIFGKANMKDVVIKGVKSGVETRYNGELTLDNVTITSDGGSSWYGACLWSCNFNSKGEDGKASDHIGTATIIVNSGTYISKACSAQYGNVVACGGTVKINGGTFESPEKHMFAIEAGGRIEVTGGTFNDVAFEELDTVEEWKALCVGNVNVTIADGVVTITK